MIINPLLSGGGAGGAQAVIGSCTLYDTRGNPSQIPIYQGVPPLDALAVFETLNDVVQTNGDTAEYVNWASLQAGEFLFYRGVQDGDSFQEKVV